MCGHVGVAGNIWKTEKEAFRLLQWFDWTRGPHSTGIGTVTRNNKIGYMKNVGSPEKLWEAFERDGMSDGLVEASVKVLIGHNRWATMGAKTSKNAHPFMHGHILGAHNGTLTRHHLSNFPKHKEFEVDSECIFESLASDGFEKTMSRIHGAYALVWYDSKTEKVNFIRNDQRPLYATWNSLGDCLFWASEKWMLEIALDKLSIKHGDIDMIPVDTLYQLDVRDANKMKEAKFEEVGKFKGFEVPVFKSPFQKTETVIIGGKNTTTPQTTAHGGTSGILDDGKWGVNKIYNYKKMRWDLPPTTPSVTTPVNTNVIALPTTKSTKVDYKEYKSYSNKEIDFQIYAKEVSKNSKTPYFAASIVGKESENSDKIEVRVYGCAHDKAKVWLEWDGYFNGKVRKAVSHKGEMYLLIDLRTIEAREWAEEEEDNNEFLWFNDVKIDQDQWTERTACGCINCTDKPRALEHEFVTWLNQKDFLCADCSTSQEVVASFKKKVG